MDKNIKTVSETWHDAYLLSCKSFKNIWLVLVVYTFLAGGAPLVFDVSSFKFILKPTILHSILLVFLFLSKIYIEAFLYHRVIYYKDQNSSLLSSMIYSWKNILRLAAINGLIFLLCMFLSGIFVVLLSFIPFINIVHYHIVIMRFMGYMFTGITSMPFDMVIPIFLLDQGLFNNLIYSFLFTPFFIAIPVFLYNKKTMEYYLISKIYLVY